MRYKRKYSDIFAITIDSFYDRSTKLQKPVGPSTTCIM